MNIFNQYFVNMRSSKFIIISIAFVCVRFQALAWHEYHPMIVEGRRWDCMDCSFVIQGDTVIGGQAYKKVYKYQYAEENSLSLGESSYYCGVREDNKKVYIDHANYAGNRETLLYDFSLGPVHECDTIYGISSPEWVLESLSSKNCIIAGAERRFTMVGTGSDSYYPAVLQIEGVGYMADPFKLPNLGSTLLLRCYDGAQLILDLQNDDWGWEGNAAVTDGEVNGDSSVDIADVNAVIDMMLEKPLAPSWDDVAADMDLNGTIDIADVNAIINAMLCKR